MKTLFTLLFIVFTYTQAAFCQALPVEWTRFIGQSTGCCVILNCAIPARDGGIIFTGSANVASDTLNGDIPPSTYAGVLVCKVDSNANILWVNLYGGSKGVGICETPDGGYGVIAYTGDIGIPNGDITGYHGGGDIWLIRIDSIGNFLWGNCYGSNGGDEEPLSISTTKDNGFILLGASNGAGQDVPFHLGGSEFEYDWFVVKTDSTGNKKWTKDLGGSNDEAPNFYGSILTANNCYYLASSTSSIDFNCTDTGWHSGANTITDYYLLKLDTIGNVVWDKSFGGSRYDEMKSAVLDPRDSTIVITGASSSNDYMVTGNPGGNSMWTIKVDMNGNLIWEKSLGGTHGCGGINITLNPDSGYVIMAGTQGIIGETDNWVFLIDNAGYDMTDKIFGGVNYDYSASIFPFKRGFIATGSSYSDSFTEGTNRGWRSTGEEAFISYLDYWPAGVQQFSKNNGTLQVYPNPANDKVRIWFPTSINESDFLGITNIMGQIVFEEKIIAYEKYTDISTSNWASGFYIVYWQNDKGLRLFTKLIKE